MSEEIFISYRREDSAGITGRLFDRLKQRFPRRTFIDIESIEPGEDFLKDIDQAVASCDVLIAVIGKRWLFSLNREGRSLLENPEDYVRWELATALKRNIHVIPVLVEGASMPASRELPEELKSLARRSAVELSHTRFDADAERLVEAVKRYLEQAKAQRQERTATEAGEETGHILDERTKTEQTQSAKRKWRASLWSIFIVAFLLIIGILAIVSTMGAKKVKFGDKVFLRNQANYVINADIGVKSKWPRLGNDGKVPLTLLGNGPLQHRSVVQIQSLEDNLNGDDVLEAAYNASRLPGPSCDYQKQSDEKSQSWTIIKLDKSDPALHYGDKFYLENVYFTNQHLTPIRLTPIGTPKGFYLTVDEEAGSWWMFEKK